MYQKKRSEFQETHKKKKQTTVFFSGRRINEDSKTHDAHFHFWITHHVFVTKIYQNHYDGHSTAMANVTIYNSNVDISYNNSNIKQTQE